MDKNKYEGKSIISKVDQEDAIRVHNQVVKIMKEYGQDGVVRIAAGARVSTSTVYDIINHPDKPMTVKCYIKMIDYFERKEQSRSQSPEEKEEHQTAPTQEQPDPKMQLAIKGLQRLEQVCGRVALELAYLDLYVLEVQ